MKVKIVKLDAGKITDWESFHDLFAEVMGFPEFYGRNMDAWIDCMSYLDEPESGMTALSVPQGGVLTLHMEGIDDLADRCPEIYEALVECAAFVNHRRIARGDEPVLALSFHRHKAAEPR